MIDLLGAKAGQHVGDCRQGPRYRRPNERFQARRERVDLRGVQTIPRRPLHAVQEVDVVGELLSPVLGEPATQRRGELLPLLVP